MKIQSLNSVKNLSGKKILLRVDFNVPLEAGKIKDDYKIVSGLDTIRTLSDKGASLIILTHLGDPGGKIKADLSTAPLAARLKKLLQKPVKFVADISGPLAVKEAVKMRPGEIIFLENVRFAAGELKNDKKFAKSLAALADIYVNDAFAVSHRAQASVSAIKSFLPSYAGLLLEKEIKALQRALKPKKPLVAVMGGAKISTKAPIIKNIYPAANKILLGGGLANSFLKYHGYEIGRSLYDQESLKVIKRLMVGKAKDKKIILPVDVVVKISTGKVKAKAVGDVGKQDIILDIGPKTVELYAGLIKSAKTIIWNGPMGKFEEARFRSGTISVARVIASHSSGRAYGLAGGGETVEALKLSGMMEYVDWVSTAGGAMLAYLSKDKMPGLTKIIS